MQSTLVMQQVNFYDGISAVSRDFPILEDRTCDENQSPQESHHHKPEKMKKVLHEPTSDLELEMEFAPVKKLKTINEMKTEENDDENSAQERNINSKKNEIEPSTDNENLTNEDIDLIKGTPEGLIQEIKPIEAFSSLPINTLGTPVFPQIPRELNQLNIPTLNLLNNNLEIEFQPLLEQAESNEDAPANRGLDGMELENKKQNDSDPEDLIQQKQANILNSEQSVLISSEKSSEQQQPVEKKKRAKLPAPNSVVLENKSPEVGRRGNRWQELKALQEAYLIELQKPYLIEIHIDPINPNPKLKFTPIGQTKQVKVPKLILNSSHPTRKQIKCLWKPVDFDQDFLIAVEGKIRKIIGEKDISQEKVIELLKRFNMDDTLLIRELTQNISMYKNYLKVSLKPQRKGTRRGQSSI